MCLCLISLCMIHWLYLFAAETSAALSVVSQMQVTVRSLMLLVSLQLWTLVWSASFEMAWVWHRAFVCLVVASVFEQEDQNWSVAVSFLTCIVLLVDSAFSGSAWEYVRALELELWAPLFISLVCWFPLFISLVVFYLPCLLIPFFFFFLICFVCWILFKCNEYISSTIFA